MKPTRSLAVIAEHQVKASAAGRSLFLTRIIQQGINKVASARV
jgi:hypothetical protein